MIELEYDEKEKVDNLYKQVKNIILSKKDNQSYEYSYKQHYLYEESQYPGISKNYYNESGAVEFENINGKIIRLEIHRWHPHMHNGCSGLNGNPCLIASIYEKENEEKQELWKLNVESGTSYYKVEVSSLEIPSDILQERTIPSNCNIKEKEADETKKVNDRESQIIQSLETRILFDEIGNLCNNYKIAIQAKENLLLKRTQEIKEASEKITLSYSQKLAQNDRDIFSIKNELKNLDKLLAKYSTFNIELIGKAIQQLMSNVECTEYIYAQVFYKSKKIVHGVMDSWDEVIQKQAIIIVRKDEFSNYDDSSCKNESIINDLIKTGKALLLFEQDIYNFNKEMTFYTSYDGKILCHFDFGGFDYIKEFIESIIQYRFQNNIIELTEKDILLFMKKFLIVHKDTIIKNYDYKFEETVLSLKLGIS